MGILKHGHLSNKRSSTYVTWMNAIQRCTNPRNKSYAGYGGRGIKVCAQWQIFSNFLHDMGEKPEGLQLDRINSNGDYEPGNCRWATPTEQANNTRRNHRIELRGENLTLAQWMKRHNLLKSTIYRRLERGWCLEDAIFTPSIPAGQSLKTVTMLDPTKF